MKDSQPDFGAAFNRKSPSKLTWTIRSASNRLHDLIYFESYLHDARLKTAQTTLLRKALSIQVNRDCWELPIKKHKRSQELYIANSLITLTNVSSYSWEFSEEQRLSAQRGEDLWISAVFFDEGLRHAEEIECLIFSGWRKTWRLKVFLNESSTIKLRDLEIPYLWSEKHGEKGK